MMLNVYKYVTLTKMIIVNMIKFYFFVGAGRGDQRTNSERSPDPQTLIQGWSASTTRLLQQHVCF